MLFALNALYEVHIASSNLRKPCYQDAKSRNFTNKYLKRCTESWKGGLGNYTYHTNFTAKANFPNECNAHRKREFQKTEKQTTHMLTNIYILHKKYKNNYK